MRLTGEGYIAILFIDGKEFRGDYKMSVKAYLDPSVMTYAIQAIAGVVIAVGAAVGIYWRKAKKKINDKLGIDENMNKEVEDDVVEVAESTEPER